MRFMSQYFDNPSHVVPSSGQDLKVFDTLVSEDTLGLRVVSGGVIHQELTRLKLMLKLTPLELTALALTHLVLTPLS